RRLGSVRGQRHLRGRRAGRLRTGRGREPADQGPTERRNRGRGAAGRRLVPQGGTVSRRVGAAVTPGAVDGGNAGGGEEFDVVVVGSGAAGMTAALRAAHSGLSTVVVEKAAAFGGST